MLNIVVDPATESWASHLPGVMGHRVQPCDVRDLMAYAGKVPATPNPYNPATFLKRKQTTFGVTYKFAGQTTGKEESPDESEWPVAVQTCVRHARETLAKDFPSAGVGARLAAHVNWYADGSVGVMPHADDEPIWMDGAPIYSYTFLPEGSVARKFQIYKTTTAPKTAEEKKATLFTEVALENNDVLVMGGHFQKNFMHGLEKANASTGARVNVTVRVVDEQEVAREKEREMVCPGAPKKRRRAN